MSQTIPQQRATQQTTLATVPPPKRALDTLHESYRVLGLDDSRPLTHELLRSSYKRAAARAHPDKGGNSQLFDEVTRAYLYLEEVLNKLSPKSGPGSESTDARFSAPVTKESALRAREVQLTPVVDGPVIEDKPPVSLNPKNLNMDVFNRLFEENRLPDPGNDGYGDWLKSNGSENRLQNHDTLRSKFNVDVFNKVFSDSARSGSGSSGGQRSGSEIQTYGAPDAIVLTGGTELGGSRALFTAPMALGSKKGAAFTDLKYAYSEGATFSQQVADVTVQPRKFEEMKREREAAPKPLSREEQSMLDGIELQRKAAEAERVRRLAAQDVDADRAYARMKQRLMIQ